MVPRGDGLRGRRAATLAALLLVAASASTADGAIWDNWSGGNANNKPSNNNAPVAGGGVAPVAPVAPNPRPSVVQSILGVGGGGNAIDAGAGIPKDLDLQGVDAHSLITPSAAGHAVPPGQCGVYTRGEAEVAICVDSVVEFGADIKQMNGFLVNYGSVGVCDLIVQPVVPQGAVLASFWPDWAVNNLDEIYLEPGLTTAVGTSVRTAPNRTDGWTHRVACSPTHLTYDCNSTAGLTMRPNGAAPDALPRVDVYAFKDCSRSEEEVATGETTFRLEAIEEVVASAIEVLAVEDKAAATAAHLAPAPFDGHFVGLRCMCGHEQVPNWHVRPHLTSSLPVSQP